MDLDIGFGKLDAIFYFNLKTLLLYCWLLLTLLLYCWLLPLLQLLLPCCCAA